LNTYEGVFIAKPNLTDDAGKKLLAQIEQEITKNNGKVDGVENWGRRAIAYPIKKNKDGIYYKLDFTIEPAKVTELKKIYRLNEDILRVMIVRRKLAKSLAVDK